MLRQGDRSVGATTAINQDISGRTVTKYTQKSVNGSSSKLHEAMAVDVGAAGAGAAEGQRLLPSVPLMSNIWWIVSQVSPQPFYLISG